MEKSEWYNIMEKEEDVSTYPLEAYKGNRPILYDEGTKERS